MKKMSIDIEAFSTTNLTQSGVYRYVEDSQFEILLFAFSLDDQPVEIIDLANGETIPNEVKAALLSNKTIKYAFNANFERVCLSKHFNCNMPPDQWRCTAVQALMLGLPGNLDGVGKVLNLEVQKDSEGKSLIRYFSIPCKPTKNNGNRIRNHPHHAWERWKRFKSYCIRDVNVEMEVQKKLQRYKIPNFEQRLWELDQHINDRGINVDTDLVTHAISCNKRYQSELLSEAHQLTGLNNPNSIMQLKKWLKENGQKVTSLNKEAVPELIKHTNNPSVKRMLEIRMEMSRTSIKKYEAIERTRCNDNRVRGLLQFYGANRTGRWAGRLVQVQNLPRNNLADLDLARRLLKNGQYEMLDIIFDNVSDILSQLVRTAFIPSENSTLIVSDFSAIEARIIAWLAGEKWRIDVFKTHGKIYEASAAQMFNVPIESINKSNPLRQKGKIAELALGYQGGKGALIQMGALEMGLKEEELSELVSTWRKANPNIVRLWFEIEKAAIEAIRNKAVVSRFDKLIFVYESGILFIQLPSGRKIAYVKPKLQRNERFNKVEIIYEGMESGKWSSISTYGGKLTENIVQGIARDCLAESLIRLNNKGYKIVMHVHDEVVLDAKEGSLKEVEQIMSEPIAWAKDLPLNAEGFKAEYYRKE